jgi:hypothetical protein
MDLPGCVVVHRRYYPLVDYTRKRFFFQYTWDVFGARDPTAWGAVKNAKNTKKIFAFPEKPCQYWVYGDCW